MRGNSERVEKAKRKALDELVDRILEIHEMPDFVEVIGVMGGDALTFRIYDDGRIYER